MYIEYRIDDGEWQADPHHVKDEDGFVESVSATGRNYSLFAALAGVRGAGPSPRGLPDDVSNIVKDASDTWDCDGHSHSWITVDEFDKLISDKNGRKKFGLCASRSKVAFFDFMKYWGKQKDAKKPKMPPYYSTIVNYCKNYEENIDHLMIDKYILGEKRKLDIRLVYWFDN